MEVDYIDRVGIPYECNKGRYERYPHRITHLLEDKDIENDLNGFLGSCNNCAIRSLAHFIDDNKDIDGYIFLKELIDSKEKDNLIMALTIINQL